MAEGKSHLILNATGRMVSSHSWGGDIAGNVNTDCPISPPAGGSVMEVNRECVYELTSLMAGGQIVTVEGYTVKVDGEPIGTIIDGELILG